MRRIASQRLARSVTRRLEIDGDVLIVAPHPDDETFGTGMLLAAAANGSVPPVGSRFVAHVAFLTSGNASHRDCCQIDEDDLASAREATAIRAAATLGVPRAHVHFLRFRDGELPREGDPRFEDACSHLTRLITELAPACVFTTNAFEAFPDHLAADQLTRRALLRSHVDADLYHYCVWFWVKIPLQRLLQADWANAFVVDEPAAGLRKEEAIRAYLADVAACGHPYCGRLPSEFLKSVSVKRELFFRVPRERW